VPFLLALACAANVGSAATLIGNPQNMLIGQTLGLSFTRYLAQAALPTVAGLVAVGPAFRSRSSRWRSRRSRSGPSRRTPSRLAGEVR